MIILTNDSDSAFLTFVRNYPASIEGKREEIVRVALSTGKIKVLEAFVSKEELATNRALLT
jgi:hypothetical protein